MVFFFCTWKTAVAVNFHQFYPWNQPAWCLKKVYFPRFPGRIFTCKYPTVNSGNSNSKVDQMQVGICLIKTNLRYAGLFENRAQYCNCNCIVLYISRMSTTHKCKKWLVSWCRGVGDLMIYIHTLQVLFVTCRMYTKWAVKKRTLYDIPDLGKIT